MAQSVVWGIAATSMALISGALVGNQLSLQINRKRHLHTALLGSKKIDIRLILAKGIPFLNPLCDRMLSIESFNQLAEKVEIACKEKDIVTSKHAITSLLLTVSILSAIIAILFSHSIVFGVAIFAIVCLGAISKTKNVLEKRRQAARDAIPEALRSMETCFQSGQSLTQTLIETANEVGGILGSLFRAIADRLEMGETPTKALSILQDEKSLPELTFLAVALNVHHASGGSIVSVLESVRDSVEDEIELMRTLRVQTAQAKLSASIVTIMPFILLAFFSLMSPDFLAPFFSSFIGVALLALALFMQITGVLIVRKMLHINV